MEGLRSRKNSVYPINVTNDTVVDFAMMLDTQVKKCMLSLDSQDLIDLVPMIVSVLISFDENITQLLECQSKRDSMTERNKTLTLQLKEVKSELVVERQAHSESIEDSDSQIRDLVQDKNQLDSDLKRLRAKIEQDKNDIDCINQNIIKMAKENNRMAIENSELKDNIENLKDNLENLKSKVKANNNAVSNIPSVSHVSTNNSFLTPSTSENPKVSKVKCNTIHILGDSNIRGLGAVVKQYVCRYVQVRAMCVPGGGLCQLNAKFIEQPKPGDLIAIHSGGNDVCSTKWDDVKQSLHSIITQFPECKFVIFSVPARYDYPFLNKHVNKFNTLLKYALQDYQNVQLIQTRHLIRPNHMKRDGIHYNAAGQNKLAKKIVSMVHLNPELNVSPIVNPGAAASPSNLRTTPVTLSPPSLQEEMEESFFNTQ